MTPTQRETLDRTLRGLIMEYGAWAVLHRTAVLLKPVFVAMDTSERKPKQPRRPQLPACETCVGSGYNPEDGDSDCPDCVGTGYKRTEGDK